MRHLKQLEAESIEIIREAVCGARKPVMLYSMGKDSSVMLHLAQKAFYPASPPFPLLHIDTTWKFQAMYAFRNKVAVESGMKLLVHVNPKGIENRVNPFTHGSRYYTDVMKTQALQQALNQHGFDIIFGGARRDEEQSRAKERIFSVRSASHRWDPKSQRPELWNLYNTHIGENETLRVFPLSNWTELDIWRYVYVEAIPIVDLYFAHMRPVVRRSNTWILVDDARIPLGDRETPEMRSVRFRTLGCYPLTGAIDSQANTIEKIIAEITQASNSEREGRLIDSDQAASMEVKKEEGYF